MGYGIEMPQAIKKSSVPLLNHELVAAPAVVTNEVKCAAVYVMSDTAGTVELESGAATLKWPVWPADNGGQNFAAPVGQFLFKCAAGEALTVKSDITGEHAISILYTVS